MKKQRGLKRKIKSIKSIIKENTSEFPADFYLDSYWNFRIPASRALIQYSSKIQIQLAHFLINSTKELLINKPPKLKDALVTLMIKPFDFWESELIIHKDIDSYKSFYNRNNNFQKWVPIENSKELRDYIKVIRENNLQVITLEETNLGEEQKNIFFVVGEVKMILE
ncbi:DUF3916 domain-containing protein [Lysinibacillus sp. 54212]|uniref:DUF3916 domain-containing protein n=1 Tax=Lysinibacillus sp. 54212 TaxID=3119829 RepID=UPI002FC7CB1A